MAPRILLLTLPLLAACAASPAAAPVNPAALARAAQCAEENPLDAEAQLGCESDRARAAAPAPSPQRRAPQRASAAPLVLVLGATAPAPAGQGLADYGRQLAASPVRCTSIRMGAFVSTACR